MDERCPAENDQMAHSDGTRGHSVRDFLEGLDIERASGPDLVFIAELIIDADDLPQALSLPGEEIFDLRRCLSAAVRDARGQHIVQRAAIGRLRKILSVLQRSL